MSLIFIELARCYQGNQEHEYHKSNKNYLTEVLQYMDDHCIDCTLESTAAHFGFHPNYLSRMVRRAPAVPSRIWYRMGGCPAPPSCC